MVNIKVKEAESSAQRLAKRRLKWFSALNFLAIFITGYLTYLHYKPSASTICKINEYWDCDVVNKSVYSELFGVPVAVLGLLTYLLLFFMARAIRKGMKFTRFHPSLTNTNLLWFLFGVVAFGVAFSGYLTYIEIAVLRAICIFCFAQQIIIILDFLILFGILKSLTQEKKQHSSTPIW